MTVRSYVVKKKTAKKWREREREREIVKRECEESKREIPRQREGHSK